MPKVLERPNSGVSPDVLRARKFREEAEQEARDLFEFKEKYLREHSVSPTKWLMVFLKKHLHNSL